jgi:hypothetical protein
MAKTLRVREAEEWVTKAPELIPENRLSPEEIDDNFLALESRAVLSSEYRNKVINGNFNVWQKGTSFTAAGYTADRWIVVAHTNVPAIFRSGIELGAIPKSDSKYGMRVTVTADAAAAAYQIVGQRIESVRTLAGQKAVFSFWVYCTTDKDISVSFRQYFGTGSPGESPSANVNFNGTTTKFAATAQWVLCSTVVDIPSVEGKTIGTDSNDYLYIMLWFSAGSDHDASNDSLGHQTGVFYIADVQLAEGEYRQNFENRSITIENLLCHRYHWRINPGQINSSGAIDNTMTSMRLGPAVPMRVVPTASSDFSGTTYTYVDTLTWVSTGSNGSNGGLLYFLSDSATARPNVLFVTGANDYIALAAEL